MRHKINPRLLKLLLFIISQCLLSHSFAQFREKYRGSNDNNAINGMSFITPSTGYVAFNSFIGFTTDSGKTFIHRDITYANTDYNGYTVNLTFGFNAKGVVAFSVDSVFAFGHYGTEPSILFSSNQGQNWKLVFHRDYNPNATVFNQGITDLEFINNGNVAFAVHNEQVLKTTNRGQSWFPVLTVANAQFRKISFPSLDIGYVTGKSKVYKTSNAGLNWSELSIPDDNPDPYLDNISFLNINTGYLLDNTSSKIFKTTNGGASWLNMNNPALIPIAGSDMHFTNDSTGFVAREFTYLVYKTTDNGTTWEPCKKDVDYAYLNYGFNCLYFYNLKYAWVGGMHEYLMITSDSGKVTAPKSYFQVDSSGYYNTGLIKLVNYSKKTYQYKWYKNSTLISTAYNTSYVHNVADNTDTIKLVVSNGVDSDTLIQYQSFVFEPVPVITSFFPKAGSTGTLITISGINFEGVTAVSFGNTPAASFTIISDISIQAIVANGSSGKLTLSKHYASGSLDGFVYTPPPVDPAPLISSFSPASGKIGTTVIIKGDNFNPVLNGNIVYFGQSKAVVNSASKTEISCTVPIGASCKPIVVLNTANHLSGHSPLAFNAVFEDSLHNFTTSIFTEAYNIHISGFLRDFWYVAAHDIDGDDKVDIVAAETFPSDDFVRVYRNIGSNGQLNFDGGVNILPLPGAQNMITTLSDLDGDSKLDFIAPTNMHSVVIARNTSIPGTVSAEEPFDLPCADGSQMIAADDLDNDGRNDLVVAAFNAGKISVFRNTSSIGRLSFAPEMQFTNNGYPTSCAIGDLDGDGKRDIVVLNYKNASPSAYFCFFKNISTKGNLQLAQRLDFETPWYLTGNIYLHDIDGDNLLDIIVSANGSNLVYRNTSVNGIFSVAAAVNMPGNPFNAQIAIGNLSGDAKPDLVGGGDNSRISLVQNLSTVGYVKGNTPVSVKYPHANWGGVDCADFNLDGKPDFVATSNGSNDNYITFYVNTGYVPIRVKACYNSIEIPLESDVYGSSYQWQRDTGTGFFNIQNDEHIRGANLQTMYFYYPTPSWDGNQFRCVADNNYSSVYEINIRDESVSASLSATDNIICDGELVILTVNTLNAGKSPTYSWYVNDSLVYNPSQTEFRSATLKDKDQIKVLVESYDKCNIYTSDTSNTIVMMVDNTLPSNPGPISGPGSGTIGSGAEYLYSIKSVHNARTYNWIATQNGANNLPQTTNVPYVSVTWKDNAGSSDKICVTPQNGCGTSNQSCTGDIILPLLIISFDVRNNGQQNLLVWTTSQETNVDHFLIERSSDGYSFYPLGKLAARNAEKNQYSFADEIPVNGSNYYRLESIDKDGRILYSEIRKIDNKLLASFEVIPNPVKNNILRLVIREQSETTGVVVVSSADGKTVLKQKISIEKGATVKELNLNDFPHGMYFVKLITATSVTERKFIK